MKRFFFSLIALSAAAVGCTQSALLETPEIFNQEVSFSPYTGRTPETKAQEVVGPTGLQEDGFYVYSFLNKGQVSSDYLTNEHVEWKSGAWKYTNTVYWPDAGSNSTLSFVAYSGNAVGNGLDLVTKDGFTFTVKNTIDDQIDLLATAYQDGYKLGNGNNTGQVTLQFYHLLSRVGFKVETSTSKEITITDLKLVGKMPATGTLNFKDAVKDANNDQHPVWATKGTSSVQEYIYLKGNADPIATSNTTNNVGVRIPRGGSSTDYLMIMPHAVLDADHYVDVTYKIGSNGTSKNSKVYLPQGMEFKAGKAYELVLSISTSKLNFTVTEEDWGSEDHTSEIDKPQPMPEPEPEPEPIVPDPITPESNVTSITQDGVTVTLNVTQIGMTTAKIHITGDGKMTSGTLASELVGLVYRKINTTEWKDCYEHHGQEQFDETVVLNNLEADTEYQYCIYTWYKRTGWESRKYAEGKAKTFRTLALTTPPAATAPTLSMNEIFDEDITSTTVKVSGSFKWGTVDGGDPEAIIEYGFCWMPGVGNPSTFNDKISFSNTTGKYGKDNLYTISPVTIGSSTTEPKSDALNFNTLYSCSLYVITENGDTYYTDPIVFTTKPSVSTDDNTGAPGWE